MKKAMVAVFIMFLTLTVISGCGSTDKQRQAGPRPKDNKVRIANVVFPGGPPQGLVMLNKGILKEKLGADYEISSVLTRNIDQVSREMKTEKYDFLFAYYGTIAEYASNMSDFDNGDNFVIIANISNGPGNNLVAQPGITDIKQLTGKTVGVFNHDYAGVTLVANILKEGGLDIVERGGSVKIRVGDSGAILNDFKAGKIEALMARPSFREPGFVTLRKTSEMGYGGKPPYQVLMVRKGYLEQHPGVVEKVLEAHLEATEWIKSNRKETADIVWKESEKFYKENKTEKLMPPRAAMEGAYAKMLVDVYPNLQFINDTWGYMDKYNPKKPYPLNDIVNFAPLNRVLKTKGMPTVEEFNRTGGDKKN